MCPSIMVLQQRVYSTGHSAPTTRTINSASSRGGSDRGAYIGRSQKDFLEQHILKRREAEVGCTCSTIFSLITSHTKYWNIRDNETCHGNPSFPSPCALITVFEEKDINLSR